MTHWDVVEGPDGPQKVITASRCVVPLVDWDAENPEEGNSFLGTGFFYSPRRLMTCNHVLKAAAKTCVAVKLELDGSWTAIGLGRTAIHKELDLAIAEVRGDFYEELFDHLEVDLKGERFLGLDLMTYGFVGERERLEAGKSRLRLTPRLHKGHLTRATAGHDLEMSFAAIRGTSGSPVLTTEGRVIGVIKGNSDSLELLDELEESRILTEGKEVVEKYTRHRVREYGLAVDLLRVRRLLGEVDDAWGTAA